MWRRCRGIHITSRPDTDRRNGLGQATSFYQTWSNNFLLTGTSHLHFSHTRNISRGISTERTVELLRAAQEIVIVKGQDNLRRKESQRQSCQETDLATDRVAKGLVKSYAQSQGNGAMFKRLGTFWKSWKHLEKYNQYLKGKYISFLNKTS